MTTISFQRSPHRQPDKRHGPLPLAKPIATRTLTSLRSGHCRLAMLVLASLMLTACGSRAPLDPKPTTLEKPVVNETRTVERDTYPLYDPTTRERVASWCSLMDAGRRYPEIIKVYKVNELINKTEYIYDAPQWGQTDYWATPFELLETNKGDCEDFSIAKYYTLRKLGVPESKLRFIYTRSVGTDQAHMVLAYYPTPDGAPLILDSLDKNIKRSSERKDLLPVFSFNRYGMWISRREGDGKFLGSSARLDQWRKLQHRMDRHEELMSYTHLRRENGETLPVGMWRCKRVSSNRYSGLQPSDELIQTPGSR